MRPASSWRGLALGASLSHALCLPTRPALADPLGASQERLAAEPSTVDTVPSAVSAEHDREAARRLYLDGTRHVEAGEWALARRAYRRSFQRYPSASTLVNWAYCENQLGHLVEAWALLSSAVLPSEHAGRGLSPDRQAAAEAERDRLRRRVASVVLEGVQPRQASVAGARIVPVDGVPEGYRLIPAPGTASWVLLPAGSHIYLDPGTYRFAQRLDARVSHLTLELIEGARASLPALTPAPTHAQRPDLASVAVRQAPAAGGVREVAPGRESRPYRALGTGSLIASGVALTTALVSAGVLIDADSTLRRNCSSDDVCPPEVADTVSRYETAAVVTNVGLLAGVALGAVGLTVLTLENNGSQANVAVGACPSNVRLRVKF